MAAADGAPVSIRDYPEHLQRRAKLILDREARRMLEEEELLADHPDADSIGPDAGRDLDDLDERTD